MTATTQDLMADILSSNMDAAMLMHAPWVPRPPAWMAVLHRSVLETMGVAEERCPLLMRVDRESAGFVVELDRPGRCSVEVNPTVAAMPERVARFALLHELGHLRQHLGGRFMVMLHGYREARHLGVEHEATGMERDATAWALARPEYRPVTVGDLREAVGVDPTLGRSVARHLAYAVGGR